MNKSLNYWPIHLSGNGRSNNSNILMRCAMCFFSNCTIAPNIDTINQVESRNSSKKRTEHEKHVNEFMTELNLMREWRLYIANTYFSYAIV